MTDIRSVRGMPDITPDESPLWRKVEAVLSRVLDSYGYQEIRFPVLEKTALFSRSIGEVTDIVEKEMYSFEDRNGESLTLRPEGTAGCVRACIQNGLLKQQSQKLWYRGPMFRYERPQKGRQRQFHQLGLECFGLTGPDVDAEVIGLTARIWRELGIERAVQLEINSLGSPQSRAAHRQALVNYFEQHRDQLDEDSLRRLESNPLRILDSKNPDMQALNEAAPRLLDYLEVDCREHFEQFCGLLDQMGVSYLVNQRLVRGLDYYSRTVFEWTTTALGAQGTVCGGGRYDGLVAQLGGGDVPALGFGLGLERLLMLVEEVNPDFAAQAPRGIYLVIDPAFTGQAMKVAEQLRDALPGLPVFQHLGGGSFKSQFKKADRSGAEYALVLGENEIASGVVSLKPLRSGGEQQQLSLAELIGHLQPRQ